MSLFNSRFQQAANDLANSDDEVLQSAGMMALMRLETLQRRMKGLNNYFNKGRALTPLPQMYPNPPNAFPTPWWQQPSGFTFGANPLGAAFGASQSTGFGSSSNQPTVFGSSQPAAFGSSSNQPAGFSSSQPTTSQPTAFGSGQPSLFGSTQSTGFGSNQPATFGATQPTTFGSNQPATFGSSQPATFASSQSTGFGVGFAGPQNINSAGESTTNLYGASQPPFGASAQKTSNGKGNTSFSFGIPPKNTSDKNEEVPATSEPGLINTNTSIVPATLDSNKS
ncbi:hypothetical protein Zmor_018013 [Zophobas morio]|uniref:Uncharacterized protein n=1 Tax=Zophobas morio TaxID=2755281 RepID=A0AA38MD30_9CUCU|nr:hypothetical protein Zmor_018013 [Zophobas morio]